MSNEETLKDNIEAFYTGNQLLINSISKNLTVNVFDINGKVRAIITGKHQIDMSFLNAGFYFANISDEKGNQSVVKFVRATY